MRHKLDMTGVGGSRGTVGAFQWRAKLLLQRWLSLSQNVPSKHDPAIVDGAVFFRGGSDIVR